jgi:hypothetical protein
VEEEEVQAVSNYHDVVNPSQNCGHDNTVESYLQTQKAAVKMLHDRILVLVQYVTEVIAGKFHILSGKIPHLN